MMFYYYYLCFKCSLGQRGGRAELISSVCSRISHGRRNSALTGAALGTTSIKLQGDLFIFTIVFFPLITSEEQSPFTGY